jgi:UDP-hydrolysing UDP-N-acetyl-D-glucosamine 2-epimerase
MRTIGVVTVARSDYSAYLPILRKIQDDPDLFLHLVVGGMHLSKKFGNTERVIEHDGFPIGDRVEMLTASDNPEDIAKAIGLGIIGFSRSYETLRPDILVVLGDRFEMLAAVVATLPFKIPVAHIHGGESTEALIDESIRHSITKMSHLHFASAEVYASRIVQMGEAPWRVTVSGAPAIDNLLGMSLLDLEELSGEFGFDLNSPTVLVTYHPVTLEYERTEEQLDELLKALAQISHNIIFTYPNADTYNSLIIDMLHQFVRKRAGRAKIAANLGTKVYFSLLKHVTAMVGNSSSGIVEAPSFKLPVVNIGNRQQGRLRSGNIIDVRNTCEAILQGIRLASSDDFRKGLSNLVSPYGDGCAANRIVNKLKSAELNSSLLIKRFHSTGR